MRHFLTFTLALAALTLAGCASTPSTARNEYAECVLPVTRDAGMGVRVPGCVAWTIGTPRKLRPRH